MSDEPLEEYKLKLKNLNKLQPEFPKVFTKVTCPSCSKDVEGESININDKIAKCNHCAVVFPFNGVFSGFETNQANKLEVLRPEGIDLFHFKDELDISVQQPVSGLDIILLTISLLGTFVFFMLYLKEGFAIWWPLIFGIGIIYEVFNLFNRSQHKIFINIDDKNLTLRWHPRKFNKDQSFAIQDIDQLYVTNVHGSYRLIMAVNTMDGLKEVKLMPYMSNKSKVRYLEQEIERFLGIIDRPMPEEIE